jgi:hypothetical protein
MSNDEFTILKFPSDYQVGWLFGINRKRNQYDKDVFYADAIGQVSVPSDISLMLNVNSQSAASMRWLTEIESTQLKQLYLGQTGINNENIQFISHLSSLEMLSFNHVYENINDLGTHHLKRLINLRSLYLNSTDIGNITLSYLSNMHQLEYLSIGGTNVTDNGLQHLYELSSLKEISFDLAYSGGRKNYVTLKGIENLQHCFPECKITACDLSYLLSD